MQRVTYLKHKVFCYRREETMPLANGGKQCVPAEARECLQDCSSTLQDLIDQDGDVRTVRDNLMWSIAACQRAIDTMRSLEDDLAHSPKRRRVSWEPAEAENEDCDQEPRRQDIQGQCHQSKSRRPQGPRIHWETPGIGCSSGF